jgi:hypothetical protein
MTRVFSPKLLPLKPISETNSPSLGEAPRHLPIRRLHFHVAELDGLVSGGAFGVVGGVLAALRGVRMRLRPVEMRLALTPFDGDIRLTP